MKRFFHRLFRKPTVVNVPINAPAGLDLAALAKAIREIDIERVEVRQ